ncbi:hypothetical protein [Halomicrobium salinisoli]|uniref:hypothetical protein n=1 Tax=Halomicrobium salinisoli TaxID=2878391 RepID=UPI001CF0A956|nr:hypothetical protein [Halomicrobium salinisoli]
MVTRRDLLRRAGGAVAVGLAGCSGPTRDADASPDTAGPGTDGRSSIAEASPTPDRSPSAPSMAASVVRQAARDHPARVRATVRNPSSESVELRYGATLLFTDHSDHDDRGNHEDHGTPAWPEALVLDPVTYVGPWDEPVRSDDECWRFPSEGRTPVQDVLQKRALPPGESRGVAYDVYTRGTDRPCLPEGSYRFVDGGGVRLDEWRGAVFALTVDVAPDGTLSARAELTLDGH